MVGVSLCHCALLGGNIQRRGSLVLFCFFPCLSPTHSWRLPEQRQSPAKHTSHLISVFALEICRHCSLLSDRKTKTRTVRFKRL